MIKNYLCSKCHNFFSQQDFPIHYKYCSGNYIPNNTTIQYNTKGNTIQNQPIYTTNYSNTSIPNNNIITTQPRIQTTVQVIPPKITTTQIYRGYRPQTAIYNTPLTQQIQPNKTNITNNISPQYYNNINYNPNYSPYESTQNIGYFTCDICQKTILSKDKKDHLLCHKIDQEEKDKLQAQRMQDELLFDNMPQDQIEQQRNIEQQIRQEQQRRTNNNNNFFGNSNNNFMDDFGINSNFGNLNNFDSVGNTSGGPNVIIRRFTSNGNSPNFGGMGTPDFFTNFFNSDMNGMNNGNISGMRRIMIPMSFTGSGGGNQNELNDLIERMLHYSRENPTDATIVSELPETQIDDIKKLDKDKQNCVICMEDFKNGDKSTNLPCLHMFHTNCIQSWLKTQNTCPICKFKLTQDNINNINRRA